MRVNVGYKMIELYHGMLATTFSQLRKVTKYMYPSTRLRQWYRWIRMTWLIFHRRVLPLLDLINTQQKQEKGVVISSRSATMAKKCAFSEYSLPPKPNRQRKWWAARALCNSLFMMFRVKRTTHSNAKYPTATLIAKWLESVVAWTTSLWREGSTNMCQQAAQEPNTANMTLTDTRHHRNFSCDFRERYAVHLHEAK